MKRVSWLLSAWLFLVIPVNAVAQSSAANDWARLAALTEAPELFLETKSNKKAQGKLASVSTESLTLEKGGTKMEFARAQIRRVYRLSGNTRGRSGLKGMGIGAAIGLGAGLIFYLPATDDNEVLAVPAFTLIGAGLGAGIGALAGNGQKRALIYSAD